MLVDGFRGEEIVGVLKLLVSVVHVGGDEEAVAVNFCGVVLVDGLKVICEEAWDDSVWSWLVGGEESADNLGKILKIGLGEMERGEEGERRGFEVVCDQSIRVSGVVLPTGGGWETRREVTHGENCFCWVSGGAVMLRLCWFEGSVVVRAV